MEAQHRSPPDQHPTTLDGTLKPKPVRFALLVTISLLAIAILSACDAEPRKTDAELGLNPQQASGRRVYDARCGDCHYAYSKRNLRGPSLNGLFKKQFMQNGMPANNERVADIIVLGRAKMPAFQNKLTQQQFDDLMAYLHTL
jgi:mono/diheme cytochrome c family protein